MMDILSLIKNRRSIRKYSKSKVNKEDIDLMLEAGRWAPSGLNNQPWKFKVIDGEDVIRKIASFSKYKSTIIKAPALIIVFLDKSVSYDRTKDIQAIGACIENMLLMAESRGIGTCWMGEIINQGQQVEEFLSVNENLELMAVICVGYKNEEGISDRKSLEELCL